MGHDISVIYFYKSALFVSYLFSYYLLLLLLIIFFFIYNIRYLRYVSELSFYSQYAGPHSMLTLAITALAGLPPLFFFYPKLAIAAIIVLQGPWYFSIVSLLLIYVGWFIYLNVVRSISTQCWSFSSPQDAGARRVNTGLATLAVLGIWFTIAGIFFMQDILLLACWLFI